MLSVIIPTYNPDFQRITKTLNGLKEQTLPVDLWELLIIDNNSSFSISEKIDLSWHPGFRVITEPKQGLTFARIKGFVEAKGEIIVLVDDDNILEKNYLKFTLEIFSGNSALGAIGGKSIPLFECEQPAWMKDFYGNLALRDLGEEVIINSWNAIYPIAAPVGAGMCLRKNALETYITKIISHKKPVSDRTGNSLSSGGDNDIVLEVLKSGWQIGYFPALSLQHIIPKERIEIPYLAALINNTNKSWVELLESHGINPWKKIAGWSVPLRKIKAWFTYKAWQNKVNYIKWYGACGLYDGLDENNYTGRKK
ncbi:MAG: glycosyltransferase [Mucilaginibacter sp.]|nr:glycosyltransferase [Mucilaginibacter sp.]